MFERDLGKGKVEFGFSGQKERGLVFVVLNFDLRLSEKKVAPPLVAGNHRLLRWNMADDGSRHLQSD